MEPIVIIIIIAVVLLALVGSFLFLGRGRQSATLERPSSTDLDRPQTDASDTAVLDDADATELDLADATDGDEADPLRPPSFRDRLGKARGAFSGYFGSVRSRGGIDDETWEELEEALILADVGIPTTTALLGRVRERVRAEKVKEPAVLMDMLQAEMTDELGGFDISLKAPDKPSIWLFVGVNGVGKTTTIGKLANREVAAGRSVVLGAGDTFRAAAAEQLQTWAERAGADFIRGAEGADPSSVLFDTIEHGAANGADLVLADTAGRLHTKTNLMDELRKVRRVAEKARGSITEVLLVLDATTGQNGLTQAKQFTDAVNVTGVVLTKLDGSAKGGIVLAIQSELGIPVKLVGLGEGIEDLVEFDAGEFVDALFS